MAEAGTVTVKIKCEIVEEEPKIVGMDGEDRLTLQHCMRQPTRADGKKGTEYPDYLTMHIGGEAGGFSGYSFIQICSKNGSSYHTWTLQPSEAGALRDWLNKHVEGPLYDLGMYKVK